MALSNRERVGRILETLKEGLAPFVVREYRQAFGQRYGDEMEAALSTPSHPGLLPDAWTSVEALVKAVDAHDCLHLMW